MKPPRRKNLGLTSGVSPHKSPACAVVRTLVEWDRGTETSKWGASFAVIPGAYPPPPPARGKFDALQFGPGLDPSRGALTGARRLDMSLRDPQELSSLEK